MYEAFMTESIRMDARAICKLEIVGHRRPAEDARAERAHRRIGRRRGPEQIVVIRPIAKSKAPLPRAPRSAKGLLSAGLRSSRYRRLDGIAPRIVARGDETPTAGSLVSVSARRHSSFAPVKSVHSVIL